MIQANLKPERLQEVTVDLLKRLDIEATVTVTDEAAGITAAITSPDSALLIGWRGGTLAALEHVVRLLLARELEKTGQLLPEIHLDIEGYKQRQMAELTDLALRAADHVRQTMAPEILRPMNAFERRVVHVALAEMTDIVTESIGIDPNRRIMIKTK